MLPTKMNVDWPYSKIGWKMVNCQRIFCDLAAMYACVCLYVVCASLCLCLVILLNLLSVIFTQGKRGIIKTCVLRSVFMQSRSLVENGGLIVAKARHVELTGDTGLVSSCMHTHKRMQHAYTHVAHIHIHTQTCCHIYRITNTYKGTQMPIHIMTHA